MELTKKCLYCAKTIIKPQNESLKNWNERRKFCSKKCSTDYRKGETPWNKGTIGIVKAWNKGKKITQTLGEKNGMWKGDDVGYFAKHRWVSRTKGNPTKCENCGKTEGKLEWANKDHKYKRDLNDYIALCTSCHRRYDIKNNGWKQL